MRSSFPVTIRGKNYFVIQKGNIINLQYEDKEHEEDVPDEEAEVIIMYLIDEGFINL